jgi:methionyl-tRNA formyltransferase
MGSGDFAVPSFKSFVNDSDFEVVCTFTTPPKPQGRGLKLTKSSINILADEYKIPVETPQKITDFEVDLIDTIKPDFIIVVSYGQILPIRLIGIAKFCTLNLHPSSLPKYRGAAPIERAIENGETEIANCVIKMAEKLDAGDVVLRSIYHVKKTEDSLSLRSKFASEGANLLKIACKQVQSNSAKFETQNHERATYARKIQKSELFIENMTNASVYTVMNKIRAFTSYGGAYILLDGQRVKIIAAKPSHIRVTKYDIQASDGFVSPVLIKPEGKNLINLDGSFGSD